MEELDNIDASQVANLNIKIPHRNWKQAFAEGFVLMTTVMPGEVISIVGPTRAGKTELLRQLSNAVCGVHHSNGQDEEQPIVAIELVNDDVHASFTFRSFLIQALEVVRHPFYSSCSSDGWGDPATVRRIEQAREKTLNRALIRALRMRKTRFLIIDEVQHIRYVSKNAQAAVSVMDALKAMAKNANVVLIVAGTYPILEAITRSSHLEGRKYDVHLSRYHQTKEDIAEFQWILANYDEVLELDKSLPSLMDCTELLYQGTFGCIGLVRAWLYRASVQAATRQQKIDRALIQETKKSPMQLYSTAQEILIGETTLGIQPCEALTSVVESQAPVKTQKPRAKSATKPFQRKPKRFESNNRI